MTTSTVTRRCGPGVSSEASHDALPTDYNNKQEGGRRHVHVGEKGAVPTAAVDEEVGHRGDGETTAARGRWATGRERLLPRLDSVAAPFCRQTSERDSCADADGT